VLPVLRGLLAAALLLAGCSQPAQEASAPRPDGPTVVTDPRDLDATLASNGSHVHDYWKGATHRVVLDQSVVLSTAGGIPCGGGGVYPQEVANIQCHEFLLPDGEVIMPGTSRLNMTLTWSATGDVPVSASLTVTTAAGDFSYFTPPSGKTFGMNSTEAMNDPPHSTVSFWGFKVRVVHPVPGMQVEAALKVEIHRAATLPIAPAHPDRWNGTIQLDLAVANGTLRGLPATGGAYVYQIQPAPVPLETERLEILGFYNSSTPVPLHEKPRLWWHGPDRSSWEVERAEPDTWEPSQSGGTFGWTLPLEARHWDSPYTASSKWVLRFAAPSSELQDAQPSWMSGEYKLVVRAHRATSP
jgi:hypothetical protein